MRVGVHLVGMAPSHGGGFTFQDDIFQSLLRLESSHTYVVLSDLDEERIRGLHRKNMSFVSLDQNLLKRVWMRSTGMAVGWLQGIGIWKKWLGHLPTNWIGKVVREQKIEMMWFVTPGFVEVDVPYIYTVFDVQHRLQPWFPEVSSGGEWARREAWFSAAIHRAFAIIIGAEDGKEEIVKFYAVPHERVKLIPLPTPRFALEAPKGNNAKTLTKYGISRGYLFYPAQFWPHKNHIALLLALDILKKKYGLSLSLVFVGADQGNLRYVLDVVKEFDLSQQVHFLGFVPQEDLVGLYQNAGALIYPTFFGPDNLPPLEAFAAGCPVIASNVAGAQEQLGDAALLVDPKNEEDIAKAIKQVYEDRALRQTLVERGLKRARQWTGDDYVKRVLSIIDDFERIRRCWGKRYPWNKSKMISSV
jgi:glycosyltransferase involved in cell wall biosynthesis